MSNYLTELSRTRVQTGSSIVVEDYNQHPRLCRYGIWVGALITFTETVTLSFEHTDDLYVGWAINGTTVIDPGYSSGTPPWGDPVPGAPSIIFRCPVNDFFHRISFTSPSGIAVQCFNVQVLYRTKEDQFNPPHYGPAMNVCISGSEIEWPWYKLEEERECLDRLKEILKRYVEYNPWVNPWDPVIHSEIVGEEAIRIKAQLYTLDRIDESSQPRLAAAIKTSLSSIFSTRAFYTNERGEQYEAGKKEE